MRVPPSERKLVAHGSDGTNDVYDLGATSRHQWSISYYEVYQAMPQSLLGGHLQSRVE